MNWDRKLPFLVKINSLDINTYSIKTFSNKVQSWIPSKKKQSHLFVALTINFYKHLIHNDEIRRHVPKRNHVMYLKYVNNINFLGNKREITFSYYFNVNFYHLVNCDILMRYYKLFPFSYSHVIHICMCYIKLWL